MPRFERKGPSVQDALSYSPLHDVNNSTVYEGAKDSNERGFWVGLRGINGGSIKS
jgi:hypothetical protein